VEWRRLPADASAIFLPEFVRTQAPATFAPMERLQSRRSLDGMSVSAVKEAGERAVQYCRDGRGPYLLEMKTYRYRGHSMSDPAKYRTREEVQKMREQHDCIETARNVLLELAVMLWLVY
jgi:TPP-dependent pyruvate/acetoin dehydrogenase alpha subunit